MIRLDIRNVLSDRVGADHGISERDLTEFLKNHRGLIAESPQPSFADLPDDDQALQRILALTRKHHRAFTSLVHIGIGGSSLGAVALCRALCHPFHNDVATPKLYFIDNVDPETLSKLGDAIDFRRTLFYIVSKSGETVETLVGLMVFLERLARKNLVVSTDPTQGFLRKFAQKQGLPTLDIPADVGGRFTALSSVGLFPAAMAGADVKKVLAGARAMRSAGSAADPRRNPAFLYAAVTHLLYTRKAKCMNALMPYATALDPFADWFVQLWAESLGKKHPATGEHIGQTPIKAIGARDQHSLIQLFNDGPNDKVITFADVARPRWDARIPDSLDGGDVTSYLVGKRVSDVLRAEKKGTETSLTANHRPNVTVSLPDLRPEHVGALIYFFQMATVYFARFSGVDPFDQPGVDAGKNAMFALLGRPGYRA